MIEIELDGKKVEVVEGSMVMHAADKAGTYIPHFCYHKKLTIAANCRMCLVEIEKAPKPMPACATPVTQGMIVRTQSAKAQQAQKGVMEFLLINHPLDCPICDQGGECQLQDLAVGYGASTSRYEEEKRVVYPKNVGPLISMQEMNRCIHCTRCVRFGQEVAGVMELGMIHRGEHSEITTVVGDTVDSELSGNMIDICPVGALTSKPFRYSARTWELSRRKSVSPHDSVGANLVVQIKGPQVMRVVPFENEDVNECWIADRDRYSYEALHSDDRLTMPMIKQNGAWQETDWPSALEYVARSLKQIGSEHGSAAIGALGSAAGTVEELHLLAKLVRGLGSENIDHRLRHADATPADGVRWLGTSIASLSTLQRVFVIGSFLRKDHPLLAQRIRQAVRKGAKVHSLHAVHDDWAMPVAAGLTAAPSGWVQALAGVAAAIASGKGVAAPAGAGAASDEARAVAASLMSGERKAILLGNAAAQHPDASALLAYANWIGEQTGASVGYLTESANSVGAQLVGAQPGAGGLDAAKMLAAGSPMKALVLLDIEPAFDFANPAAARQALDAAALVVALTPFKSAASAEADVLLPIAPFTETSGSYVNAEGRLQSFHGVVRPKGDARPAWKVLRVLGNLLGLSGFDFETSEEVRDEAVGDGTAIAARLSNRTAAPMSAASSANGYERIADVPIYATDALVRRAPALQHTADAQAPVASLPPGLWRALGLPERDARVRVTQGAAAIELPARVDATLAEHAVRIPAGHPATAGLGAMFGPVSVEKASAA
ncbi:MAG: NADH-quinone oxidoreductase subunit G [Proteobacteria bacterium]|nr:NADH-quinone oxidoreductase subunit G [Pseudomonadota bacterium]